ncbi:hypothetical protein BDR06DRAFT_985610 [Suillus hirtellus]|nr:hypothetical protein BDR06DRAFT_985610 [Suillus hirtellus]
MAYKPSHVAIDISASLFLNLSTSDDENRPSVEPSCKPSGSALRLGPHKNVTSLNPLVLHGQHFGHTVFAMCNYPALLTADSSIEDYPADVHQEHRVFVELIDSYPGLLDHLTNDEEEDIIHVGELMGKGASGQPLILPLAQNIKSDCGFNHEVTGTLLCLAGLDWSNPVTKQSLKRGEIAVRGDQWPMFLYAGYGFKHVFTSLSSMDKEPKAMRSRNAYLHGMKSVTKASLAYIAMQIQFSLSSSSVFLRTDIVTDSENFYHSILDLLEDPDESQEVVNLMTWWTHHMFPNSTSSQRCISKNSALSKIREKHAVL